MKVFGPQVQPTAQNARNFSQCDSMLIGDTAGANTYPYIQVGFAQRSLPPCSRPCMQVHRCLLYHDLHLGSDAEQDVCAYALLCHVLCPSGLL